MADKYLSIITNFGCHGKCPYCIVRENGIKVPKTTLSGLDNLDNLFHVNKFNIISVSGGGDPLHEYNKHFDWYRKLFKIAKEYNSKHNTCSPYPVPIEMHTSYMTDDVSFLFYDCKRVVYHLNSIEQLSKIHRTGNEIVRVVYVVTEDFTLERIMEIAMRVHDSDQIDELSFRQLVGKNYETTDYWHDVLKFGHGKFWHYIEQRDYNIYYVEGKLYSEFSKIGEEYET